MRIRQATVADADLLATLGVTTANEAFGPPHKAAETVAAHTLPSFSESILSAELTDSRSFFFIVKADELTREGVEYAKLRQHQLRSAIELMHPCLDHARLAGYRVVWEHNQRAQAFCHKLGFERFGRCYFQFEADRQRDFWLQKEL